jgi:H3 lysine-79-specific histone-lysine N-methyltransferase
MLFMSLSNVSPWFLHSLGKRTQHLPDYLPKEHAAVLGDPGYADITQPKRPKQALPTPSITPDREASPASLQPPRKPESPHGGNLIKQMDDAYRMRDGIRFRYTIREINHKLRSLKNHKDGNLLLKNTAAWDGIRPEMVVHIYEETYQRSAGPRVKELLKYQAFSSTTYGELNSGYELVESSARNIFLTCFI